MKKLRLLIASLATMLLGTFLLPTMAGAASTVVYNNIPSPTPGNVSSQAFEATQTSEFGGQVMFGGTDRTNPKVTVLMSSWGCQTGHWTSGDCNTTVGATFSEPITLNVYNVGSGNAPGTLLATTTQTFNIPFRPSANNVSCTGANAGKWSDGTTCFNGFATPISFDLTGVTLPSKVIISVAYNTTHYGYNPIGATACSATLAGCGYDSLNVGVDSALTVGSYPLPADAYLNSSTGGQYCVSDQTTTGTFRLDTGCWTGFQPAFKVEASAPLVGPATDKDQCKGDGWKVFNNPTYKNQGDCVSAVASNGKAKGNPVLANHPTF